MPGPVTNEISEPKLAVLVADFARRAESFLATRPVFFLCIFTVLYIPYVCARALLKPFWYDELATLAVAQIPSIHGIFSALYAGIEPNPPLSYLLTHWSTRLGGNELITARIPSMFGFWLMCVCLYLFAARRGPKLAALLALLFPFVTDLLYYATETRPYGMLLGLAALALVAWQRGREPEGNHGWLVVLFLSLAGAMYSHYYGILIPVALLCGEAGSWFKDRVFDRRTAATLAGSYVAFLSLVPLARAETHRLGLHWAQPVPEALFDFYSSALTPFLFPLVVIVLCVALSERSQKADSNSPRRTSPSYGELTAMFAFFCIPIFTYILALLVTHTYTGRYSIAALIGMSLLFWWLAQRFFRAGLRAFFISAVILCLFVGIDEARTIRRSVRTSMTAMLQDVFPFPFEGSLPIVVQDPRDYLQMAHYAPPALANRLYYLAEPEEDLKYEGTVGLDISLRDLSKILPLHVDHYQAFLASHPQFLLFWGKPKEDALIGWQLSKLKDDGATLELVEHSRQRLLFKVDVNASK